MKRGHRIAPPALGNPWGLSAAELAALAAVLREGSQKGAARALGKQYSTIDHQVSLARDRMGHRFTLHALLELDRWARANQVQLP